MGRHDEALQRHHRRRTRYLRRRQRTAHGHARSMHSACKRLPHKRSRCANASRTAASSGPPSETPTTTGRRFSICPVSARAGPMCSPHRCSTARRPSAAISPQRAPSSSRSAHSRSQVVRGGTGEILPGVKVTAYEQIANASPKWVLQATTDDRGMLRLDLAGIDQGRRYLLQANSPWDGTQQVEQRDHQQRPFRFHGRQRTAARHPAQRPQRSSAARAEDQRTRAAGRRLVAQRHRSHHRYQRLGGVRPARPRRRPRLLPASQAVQRRHGHQPRSHRPGRLPVQGRHAGSRGRQGRRPHSPRRRPW